MALDPPLRVSGFSISIEKPAHPTVTCQPILTSAFAACLYLWSDHFRGHDSSIPGSVFLSPLLLFKFYYPNRRILIFDFSSSLYHFFRRTCLKFEEKDMRALSTL